MNRIRLKNPDYYISYMNNFKYINYSKEGLNKKSGIYVYWHNRACLYVGATQNLYLRSLRFMNDTNTDACLMSYLIDIIGKYNLKITIYFYPNKKLLVAEQHYIKKLRPLTQSLGSVKYPKLNRINKKPKYLLSTL